MVEEGAPAEPGVAAELPEGGTEEVPVHQEAAPKNWFIIHTYSGFENKVKESLQTRADAFGFADLLTEGAVFGTNSATGGLCLAVGVILAVYGVIGDAEIELGHYSQAFRDFNTMNRLLPSLSWRPRGRSALLPAEPFCPPQA